MGASWQHTSCRDATATSGTSTTTNSWSYFSILAIATCRRGGDWCGRTSRRGRCARHVLFVVQDGTPSEQKYRLFGGDVIVHRWRVVDIGTDSDISRIFFNDVR